MQIQFQPDDEQQQCNTESCEKFDLRAVGNDPKHRWPQQDADCDERDDQWLAQQLRQCPARGRESEN